MPLEGEHEKDYGGETADGPVCVHDLDEGKIKSGREIFEGGVQFFLGLGGERALAERLTRKNMKSLAYWQKHPFAELEGPLATDDEFVVAMSKM